MKLSIVLLVLLTACSTAKYIKTPTKYVETQGVRFAYRQIGNQSGIPLVLFQHFRGSMDNWDPLLIDELAKDRNVIVFDNKGVSHSSGETPSSFKEMADDAAIFITGLGYTKIDALGFSIGGAVVQELLVNHPHLVRKAILAGTAPKGGEGLNVRQPQIVALATKPVTELSDFLTLFFTPSETSQRLGREFLARRSAKRVTPDIPSSLQVLKAQAIARQNWGIPTKENTDLGNIHQDVLVANGSNDIMMPTVNSYTLYKLIPKSKLILYPDSGHGFLFQYPIEFAKDVNHFLGE